MSEPIPESIPTSVSHPSNRPTKRLRPTPSSYSNPSKTSALSIQATQISTLMSNPELPITLPPPTSISSSHKPAYQPPEIVANVQGSSAGAGSGEFHVYKASRRREYERVRDMEEDAKRENEDEEWLRKERERKEGDEREREKKRRRREKKKDNLKKGGKANGGQSEEGEEKRVGSDNNKAEKKKFMDGSGGLQVQSRRAEGDEEMESGDSGGRVGTGDGVQAQDEARHEVGVIIHDDD